MNGSRTKWAQKQLLAQGTTVVMELKLKLINPHDYLVMMMTLVEHPVTGWEKSRANIPPPLL
jgi:hypothetical protein